MLAGEPYLADDPEIADDGLSLGGPLAPDVTGAALRGVGVDEERRRAHLQIADRDAVPCVGAIDHDAVVNGPAGTSGSPAPMDGPDEVLVLVVHDRIDFGPSVNSTCALLL